MAKTFQGLKWVPEEVNVSYSKLYVVDDNDDVVFEIDKDTKLYIGNSIATPAGGPRGIGGMSQRLYHFDRDTDLLYELAHGTLLSLNSALEPEAGATNNVNVGGINSRLYVTRADNDRGYEIDPDTLSSINGPITVNGDGCGGISSNRLYTANSSIDYLYEYNIDTLVVLNSVQITSTSFGDVGGSGNRLYTVDYDGTVREHNISTLAILSTAASGQVGLTGIGGYKSTVDNLTKCIIKKATFGGSTFNLDSPLLDTKPQ